MLTFSQNIHSSSLNSSQNPAEIRPETGPLVRVQENQKEDVGEPNFAHGLYLRFPLLFLFSFCLCVCFPLLPIHGDTSYYCYSDKPALSHYNESLNHAVFYIPSYL